LNSPVCLRCGTELPLSALACPACATLRHADQLKRLALDAESATRVGSIEAAREHWTRALDLLPANSQQHAAVQQRIAELSNSDPAPEPSVTTVPERSWWRRGTAGLITAIALVAGKFKFLLLGLTKLSTFVSMFAFFGVYWSVYGWPLALGLVLSIYIHEMGHVSMLRRLGIAAGAPLFIPGVGAVVMLKQHVSDPITDAQIGLAGPVWGLGAALAAVAVYAVTRTPVWFAIAEITGVINLFNLIPVWQLDGSRGFHALSRVERWIVVAACTAALVLTGQRMLVIVGGVAVWRALQQQVGPGHTRTLVTFVSLVLALSFLSRSVS
jgi:Zn-dependent protease